MSDDICIAGTMVVQREDVTGGMFKERMRAKEENLIQAFRRCVIEQVERQWGIVIEYAENTTGEQAWRRTFLV